MHLTIEDIRSAHTTLQQVLPATPLIRSGSLSRQVGAEVCLKLENLQETGSFKVRGAYNRLLRLTEDERAEGVVAASAGNHAQGVAWAANRLGLRATVVMPKNASIRKLAAVREMGAQVVLHGSCFDDAKTHAAELSAKSGKVLIPAFDDLHVMAGQGTIGVEINEVLTPDTTVVVPVGGGGLISGIATAVKSINPAVRVVGVQTQSCPSAQASREMGKPIRVDALPTLADGIAVSKTGDLTYDIMRDFVDEIVTVDEEAIAGAVFTFIERAGLVVEGAGAVPLAALMERRIHIQSRRYVLIVSGGNVETAVIDRILQRGAMRMGRLIRLELDLPDVPGALWNLLGIVAELEANILHIVHDRLSLQTPIKFSRVQLNLETRDAEHSQDIVDRLEKADYHVRWLV